MRLPRLAPLLPLLAIALVAAPVRSAAEEPAIVEDEDGDGVDDEIDECLDTGASELVGPDGCSVCDCEETPDGDAWPSRKAYYRCVLVEARSRRQAGLLEGREFRDALRAARRSTCGDDELTRCCVERREGGTLRCRVMSWERCDEDVLRVFTVDDLDVGSCLPNPCESFE